MKSTKDLNAAAPVLLERSQKPELPVKDIAKRLTVEDGKALEITTRTTNEMANAAQFANAYKFRYNSKYAASRIELIERLAISMNGQGRRDLIDALTAGGSVPGEYYADGSKKKDYPIFEDD